MKEKFYDVEEFDFNNNSKRDEVFTLLTKVFPYSNFNKNWWKWKYKNNIFGEPLAWVACEKNTNQIIGTRFLWPWKFKRGDETILAYQSLDSATDPSYFRKGIFSVLTSEAIIKSKQSNFLIYNFPGSNSYSGYKKLGWNDLEKVSWLILPINALSFAKQSFNIYSDNSSIIDENLITPSSDFEILVNNSFFSTNWDKDTIKWRFSEHPFYKYYYYDKTDKCIFRISKRKKWIEAQLIVSDFRSKHSLMSFCNFLSKLGVSFLSINAYNNQTYKIAEKILYSFKHSSYINYVYYYQNKSNIEFNPKLELGDIDYF